MDIQMLYWHWLVLGLLLVVGEIFIPSFTILWFGLGALVVGLVELLIPMSLSVQILLWTVSSVVFTLVWFKSIKVKMAQGNRGEDAKNDASKRYDMTQDVLESDFVQEKRHTM